MNFYNHNINSSKNLNPRHCRSFLGWKLHPWQHTNIFHWQLGTWYWKPARSTVREIFNWLSYFLWFLLLLIISYILKLLSSLDMSWRQWIWMSMTPSSSMQTGFNKRVNFMIWRYFCQKCRPFILIRDVWLVGIIK